MMFWVFITFAFNEIYLIVGLYNVVFKKDSVYQVAHKGSEN